METQTQHSHETSHTHVEYTPPPITATKNGVNLNLVFTKETKGPNAATALPYYGIDTTGPKNDKGEVTEILPTLDLLIKLMGEPFVQKKLAILAKKGLKEVYERTLDLNDDKFDVNTYLAQLEGFSFQSVSLKSLKDSLDALLNAYMSDELKDAHGHAIDASEFKKRVKVIKADIDRKQRASADDEDESAPVVAS